MAKKTVNIKIPMLPNFLFDEKKNQYSICDLTEEELREVGKEWTEELVKKARIKKANKIQS